jgi:hypothetical protein
MKNIPIFKLLVFSCVLNLVIYLLIYTFAGPYRPNSILYYSCLPFTTYLIGTVLTFPLIWKAEKIDKLQLPLWKMGIWSFFSIVLFSALLDLIWFYFLDQSISADYGYQMSVFMPERKRMFREFSELPFFYQNIYANIIGIVLGISGGIAITSYQLKKINIALAK